MVVHARSIFRSILGLILKRGRDELLSIDTYKAVMYIKGHIAFAIYTPLMMAQVKVESTRVPISHEFHEPIPVGIP